MIASQNSSSSFALFRIATQPREFHGGRKHSNSKAADPLLYIEREGAAEKMGKPQVQYAYDEFSEEGEFDEIEEATAGRSSSDQQDYLERLGAVERTRLKRLTDEDLESLDYASFGTLGDTLAERHHFWREVEQLERDPRGDKVIIALGDHPDLWGRALEHIKTAPSGMSLHRT